MKWDHFGRQESREGVPRARIGDHHGSAKFGKRSIPLFCASNFYPSSPIAIENNSRDLVPWQKVSSHAANYRTGGLGDFSRAADGIPRALQVVSGDDAWVTNALRSGGSP